MKTRQSARSAASSTGRSTISSNYPPSRKEYKRNGLPFLDLKAQHEPIHQEILAAIDQVLQSQAFILGTEVKKLEERIAAYCQSQFAIGVSSGTDALLVSLMALGIGPGDEVITTPYSFSPRLAS